MHVTFLTALGTLPFADAIDNYRRLGLLVVPLAAFLIVLFISFRNGR